MRRERLLLEDIVSAADEVAEFIESQTPETFETNRMVRSAVVHQLTVIGEAVARLPQDLRDRHPNIPWADVKGFRNIVVHNYFGIDWPEVVARGGDRYATSARAGRRDSPTRVPGLSPGRAMFTFGLAVCVDSRLAGEDMITFNAGIHRDVIQI
jgi:uncharacterized protein with HEPN domain